MSQSKRKSFLEACMNTLVGYLTTLAFSPIIYHWCGVEVSHSQMGLVVFYFTILSVARSYVIRRWFNKEKPRYCINNSCIPSVLEYKHSAFRGSIILINKCHCGKVIEEKRIK